jgi:uncharacterized protein (DUF302 family)
MPFEEALKDVEKTLKNQSFRILKWFHVCNILMENEDLEK